MCYDLSIVFMLNYPLYLILTVDNGNKPSLSVKYFNMHFVKEQTV